MGGIGSGRHSRSSANAITANYRSIDIRRWKRNGLLDTQRPFVWQWSHRGEVISSIHVRPEPDRVTLTYRHRYGISDWKEKSYPVCLDWTDCHLGGQRPWFLCPAHACGRRVAILYGTGIYACRHCHELTYRSQRVQYDARAMQKADRIREKLGWGPGIANGRSSKPKGMHWKTFQRLITEYDALVQVSLSRMAARMDAQRKWLDDWK